MSLPWKTLLQKAGLAALSAAGAERWRVGEAMPGAILMLHRVRPASADPFQPNAFLEITPEFLDDVLGHLAAARIPVVSLDEAVERIGSANPGRFVVITLDDGYRDNLEHAFPVFQRHRAPFTIYIASGFVDGLANAWWLTLEAIIRGADTLRIPARGAPGQELPTGTTAEKLAAARRVAAVLARQSEASRDAAIRAIAAVNGFHIPSLLRQEFMTWEEIEGLAASPLATIGGHTVHHVALAQMPASAALAEITQGLDRLEERLGRRPIHFAYPYGDESAVNAETVDLTARAGLATAVTTRRGLLSAADAAHPLNWPRLSLNGHFQSLPEFRLLLSGVPFALERAVWNTAPFLRPKGRAVLPARATT